MNVQCCLRRRLGARARARAPHDPNILVAETLGNPRKHHQRVVTNPTFAELALQDELADDRVTLSESVGGSCERATATFERLRESAQAREAPTHIPRTADRHNL